eukprot:1677217-Amphidinium_carterae.1
MAVCTPKQACQWAVIARRHKCIFGCAALKACHQICQSSWRSHTLSIIVPPPSHQNQESGQTNSVCTLANWLKEGKWKWRKQGACFKTTRISTAILAAMRSRERHTHAFSREMTDLASKLHGEHKDSYTL